jgi:hypothetical protein
MFLAFVKKIFLLVILLSAVATAQAQAAGKSAPENPPALAASNTVPQIKWKGVCWMPPGKTMYPLQLQIAEQNGSHIVGVLRHPDMHDSTTKFKGSITNQHLTFTEYELIQGKGVYLPTDYAAEIRGDKMEGVWRTKIFFIPIKGKFSLERQKSD